MTSSMVEYKDLAGTFTHGLISPISGPYPEVTGGYSHVKRATNLDL